jgi:putative nucleotidyltransferase with HDIG domain
MNKGPSEEKIPSKEDCFHLLRSYNVPEHIISHSIQVHKVAIFIAKGLKQKGEDINLELIEAAALLHDITKMESLKTGRNHAQSGADLLRSLGYERIGDIVEQHIYVSENEDNPNITEGEIVNYSDKRVMHDRIVTIEERFQDLFKRYGKNERSRALMEQWKERALRLERKILSKLGIYPESILEL